MRAEEPSPEPLALRPPSRLSRAVAAVAVGLIRLYQRLWSRGLPRVCVFEPSCSEYGRLALRRWGLLQGIRLTRARIHRCDGGTFRGVDPPPGVDPTRWGDCAALRGQVFDEDSLPFHLSEDPHP